MAYPTNWKRKEEESASGGKYHALDSSGNNYAGLSGMDELSQAALEAAQSSWQSANKAGDQEGMDAAHQQAESIRSKYGYSGGADGSQYLPTGSGTKQAAFSYESAPSYTSRYQNQIDELTSAILNREAFSYDPETDPLYDQYKEQYTREGQRAMQDALGEVSARTGGLASSYATTAAAQANNYYMAQLADKIPELYQLAYSMYMDEGDRLRSDLAMLQGMESGDYGRYQDRLGQYNTDRSFAYGLNRDQVADQRYAQEWNYQVGRDQRSDQRYDREYADSRSDTAWEKERYANETAYDQALAKAQTLAAGGNFSGYKALGYTDEEIASLKSAYDREMAAEMLARRSGGSSSGSGRNSTGGKDKPSMTLAQAEKAIENGTVTDAVRYAYDYYMGEGAYEQFYGADTAENENAAVVDMDSVLALGYGAISADRLAGLEDAGEIESYEENGKIKFRKTRNRTGMIGGTALGF